MTGYKKRLLQSNGKALYKNFNATAYKLFTCCAKLDFKLAALLA